LIQRRIVKFGESFDLVRYVEVAMSDRAAASMSDDGNIRPKLIGDAPRQRQEGGGYTCRHVEDADAFMLQGCVDEPAHVPDPDVVTLLLALAEQLDARAFLRHADESVGPIGIVSIVRSE